MEEYISGISCTVLGRKYGTSNVTIINILKRHGIERRSFHASKLKYKYDESFFDNIDTEEKAYFLGLMYADGYNHETADYISLCLTDYELVDRFRHALATDRPIYEGHSSRRDGYIGKLKYDLRVFGKHICSALASKGCYQGKSLSLKFPPADILPIGLASAFCRGYFDGDGCIHIRKQGRNKVVHICGTEAFLTSMANRLPCPSYVRQRHQNTIWFLGIYQMEHINSFRDWLYESATIWLDRKRCKFYDLEAPALLRDCFGHVTEVEA
jgi:hypothetical protein